MIKYYIGIVGRTEDIISGNSFNCKIASLLGLCKKVLETRGLNNRNSCTHSFGGWISEIKVLAS